MTDRIVSRPVRSPFTRFCRAILVLLRLKEPRQRVPGTKRRLNY